MISRLRSKGALYCFVSVICLYSQSIAVAEPFAFIETAGKCWKTNFSPNSSLDTIVELSMKLSRDGHVEEVIVVDRERFDHDDVFNNALNELSKTLVGCGPYKFPSDLYGDWRMINIRIDPSKMFDQ